MRLNQLNPAELDTLVEQLNAMWIAALSYGRVRSEDDKAVCQAEYDAAYDIVRDIKDQWRK